jgi:hypothetical protein
MNKKLLFCGVLILAAAAGCIPSLNPAYKEENLIFNAHFVGVRTQPNSKAQWIIAKRDEKSYSMSLSG